jgi:hypothetical protein
MRLSLRALALTSFLVALTAAGIFADSSAAKEVGADFWHLADNQRRLSAAEAAIRDIDRQNSLAVRRIAIRHEVRRDLIEGRVTFEEAAGRFAELNRADPQAAEFARRFFRGRTDEDRAARQVIQHLRVSRVPGAMGLADEWDCVLATRE